MATGASAGVGVRKGEEEEKEGRNLDIASVDPMGT